MHLQLCNLLATCIRLAQCEARVLLHYMVCNILLARFPVATYLVLYKTVNIASWIVCVLHLLMLWD